VYGSKPALFVEVVDLPFDPAVVIPVLLAGDRAQVGARFATFLLTVLESEEGRRRITGIMRAAASEPEAARLVRERISQQILTPLAEGLGADEPQLRASLVATQVVGLVMARHIVQIEPLASRGAEEVAAAIAPVIQHYLAEPL
jgi:hypothetical protein